MSLAVESASHVVCFVSQSYKESGNCRRECEYADLKQVPIVYVWLEEDFQPSGWLALTMGKALYIPMFSPTQAKEQMDKLVERFTLEVKPKRASVIGQLRQSFTSKKPAAAAAAEEEDSVHAMLKLLLAKVDKLQSEVEHLKPKHKLF
jgi:hypothetical protein